MPPHQPAGIAKRAVCCEESSTLVPQNGHPLCPMVPHRRGLRQQGETPLTQWPSHVEGLSWHSRARQGTGFEAATWRTVAAGP